MLRGKRYCGIVFLSALGCVFSRLAGTGSVLMFVVCVHDLNLLYPYQSSRLLGMQECV
jgi:hypothetical protein